MSNEEEAALGIDPSLPCVQHALIAMTRPPRTWTRRVLRFCLWSFATLLTVYALLCVWINWTGARAKEQAFARVAAEGETLDFKALLPPPVDPAKNFFAIEPLKNIALVIDNDPEKGEPAEKRRALEAIEIEGESSGPLPMEGVKLGRGLDAAEFSAWLSLSEDGILPEDAGDDAATARRSIEKARPQLLVLTSALSREEAEFVPPLGLRPWPQNLMEMAVPHYGGLLHAGPVLRLHGAACALAGEPDKALEDARVLLRFSSACQKEQLVISLLVAVTFQSMSHEVIWQALASGKATDKALGAMQRDLSHSLIQPTLQCLRGELSAASSMATHMESQSAAEVTKMFDTLRESGGLQVSEIEVLAFRFLPRGFHTWNHATVLESELGGFILPLRDRGLSALVESLEKIHQDRATMNPLANLHRVLANISLPSLSGVLWRVVAIETRRRQALIACALERYFIQHQAYPTALQDLVPQFLTEVPTDAMDGKPMRYRQTEKGRYVIWATGFDGKDDEGKVSATPDTVADLYKREYLGDWAWQYDPVK